MGRWGERERVSDWLAETSCAANEHVFTACVYLLLLLPSQCDAINAACECEKWKWVEILVVIVWSHWLCGIPFGDGQTRQDARGIRIRNELAPLSECDYLFSSNRRNPFGCRISFRDWTIPWRRHQRRCQALTHCDLSQPMPSNQIDFGAVIRSIIMSDEHFRIHLHVRVDDNRKMEWAPSVHIATMIKMGREQRKNLSEKLDFVVNSVYTSISFQFFSFFLGFSSFWFRKIILIFDFTLRLATFVRSFAPHNHTRFGIGDHRVKTTRNPNFVHSLV